LDEESGLVLEHCLGVEFHVVGGGGPVSFVDGAVDCVEERGREGGVFSVVLEPEPVLCL